MIDIKSYRHEPKRGETPDNKWCAYASRDGHIIEGSHTSGHDTEQEARDATSVKTEAVLRLHARKGYR